MSESAATEGVVQVNPFDRMDAFHEFMRQRAAVEAANRPASLAEEITAKNMDAIFSAAEKDLEGDALDDAIWDAGSGGAIQGRDCVPDEGGAGLEIEIRGYRADTSTRSFENPETGEDNSKGYYITAECVCLGGPRDVLRITGLSVGEEFALQTGAMDIILRLRAFELRNRFPVRGVLVGVKTGRGQKVLKLRPMPRRTVSGS